MATAAFRRVVVHYAVVRSRRSMKLNDRDVSRFEEDGLLYLERFIPNSKTAAARDGIFSELARIGARAGGKWHLSKVPQTVRHQAEFDDVIPAELLPSLNELAGCELAPALAHPQILLTPPQKVRWAVPHLGWHLDVKAPSRDEIPGIQVFVLLDDVAPQGGGTVAIAGSHKLHSGRGGSGGSAHRVLQSDPDYRTLFTSDEADRAKFLRPIVVQGVTLQVIEMSGRAGDVYLMDMRIVHAPAPNAARNARMMLTNRYLRQR
jgi:hypothetical protein